MCIRGPMLATEQRKAIMVSMINAYIIGFDHPTTTAYSPDPSASHSQMMPAKQKKVRSTILNMLMSMCRELTVVLKRRRAVVAYKVSDVLRTARVMTHVISLC